MKYADLVAFEPIQTVIELRDASDHDKALGLVRTYVISDAMAGRMKDLFAYHLNFESFDTKGLFVVGNYGTGKSHLMAVVSAVAENAELLPHLRNEAVRTAFEPIAGRYLVARFEIGAVKTPLRDIVIKELEKNLKRWGVAYTYPPVNEITSHKEPLEAMMAAVEATHPGKGVVVVIDELLDYLKALGEGAVSAFNFLRELGEASGNGRFRVIAGVQESLISSPTFSFLASLIQKVSARFVEAWITADDLAYVVENRLLAKTAPQRAAIRKHLESFTAMFPAMSARLDDYVRLYPIHPRYVEVFEDIEIAEKREVLRTLSQEMKAVLDTEVLADAPGVLAYDAYWRVIRNTPSYLATPSVGEVEARSTVVSNKVQSGIAKKQYLPAALRIVDALSVYRLAVGGIRKPIGLTASELRDDLALLLPIPEKDPEFLTTTIESVLKEISNAVNGQFIARNETGQYYLDVDKAIDYDAQVERKVAALEPVPATFDRYYFDVLTRVLDVTATPHVPGMRIWRYQVPWPDHGVTRPGYLFFGSPNERSTAQPPRTFYIYFLAHFAPTPFEDARKDDEIFFRLARPTVDVTDAVKCYAAANELAQVTSGEEKQRYTDIAEKHRKAVARWLSDNLVTAFDVTSGGVSRGVTAAIAEGVRLPSSPSVRDVVNGVASVQLKPAFERQFPGYPKFAFLSQPVTEESRTQAADEGLRYIAGLIKSQQGEAVVDGLLLRKDQMVNPADSPYANAILSVLAAKPQGQVVNRSELIVERDGAEVDVAYGLEPEWVAVVLLALAYRGEIEISAGGQSIDPTSVAAGAHLGAEALGRFKTIQRPKATPIAALKDLFSLLELNPALVDADADKAAIELQKAIAKAIEDALRASAEVSTAKLAGEPVWNGEEAAGLIDRVTRYKDDLDRLTNLNSGGKLRLYKGTEADRARMRDGRAAVSLVRSRVDAISDLEELDRYLADAGQVLPESDPWQISRRAANDAAQAAAAGTGDPTDAKRRMGATKAAYIKRYLELHNAARLDMAGDDAKKQVNASSAMKRAALLATVEILPEAELTDIRRALASLVMCRHADELELESVAWCRTCNYKPAIDPGVPDARRRVETLEDQLDALNRSWATFVAKALADPMADEGLRLLTDAEATAVRAIADPASIPEAEAVSNLNRVLQGLQRVAISPEELLAALRKGGPGTPQDLESRLASFLAQATLGKTPSNVRLVIE